MSKVRLSVYQVVGAILLLSGIGIFFLFLWPFIQGFPISEVFYGGCILILLGAVVLIGGLMVVGLVRIWRNITDR